MIITVLTLWYLPVLVDQSHDTEHTDVTLTTTNSTMLTLNRTKRTVVPGKVVTYKWYKPLGPRPLPLNCTSQSCNCSREYRASPDKPWGIFDTGACLPSTGNYSIWLQCSSLRDASNKPATGCTVNSNWTIAPMFDQTKSPDAMVTVPVIPVTGGLWITYYYEGSSTYYNQTKNVTSPCKHWTAQQEEGLHYFFTICRTTITSPVPSHHSEVGGVKVTKAINADHMMGLATGVTGDHNNWLLIAEQAAVASRNDCVVCMGPRPIARVVPPPILPTEMYTVITNITLTGSYSKYDKAYPLTPPLATGPLFHNTVPTTLNFTCINFTSPTTKESVGNIKTEYCKNIITVDWTKPIVPRADLFYWCKQNRLRGTILKNSTGLCAVVNLILPVKVYPLTADEILNTVFTSGVTSHVHKRDVQKPWMKDDPTYIDSIGVPRGVPDEYKLADQVAAGFENLPLLGALFPVTPSKNVDRINYVHYNIQRLGNFTYEGFEAVHEQLEATSLTAFQNRIALDMLLAEKGGVCSLFPDGSCCTFIPLNTAPDGTLTQVLKKLQLFNERLKDQSGVNTSVWDSWLDVFGKYKDLVRSALLSVAIFAALLTCCGCCAIPCLRGFVSRIIDKSMAPVQQTLMDEQVSLLSSDTDEPDKQAHTV